MPQVTTVIIGAGHSGLAMSRRLAERGIEHVVLERGEVAHSWRSQRWDSFRLLTPNWMTRLPGLQLADNPDEYRSGTEFARLLTEYAADCPVHTGTTVTSVRSDGSGFRVFTDQGEWLARTVVVASGAFGLPKIPPVADALPGELTTISALDYSRPEQLPEGGVLVVGASATGVQLAEEIHLSGRPVTLAVGEHVRMPRTYRGRDVLWWMDATGLFTESIAQIDDLVRARDLPSMQLIGAPRTLDLNALTALGVRLVGRLVGARDGVLQFSGSLRNVCQLADLKLGRLLDTFDSWAENAGVRTEAPERFPETALPESSPLTLDPRRAGIRSVVWATGFHPDTSWLELPVHDRKGRIRHDGGVTDVPGVYVLGLPFLRRRNSTLIDGAAADTGELAEHLVAHLREPSTV